MLLRVSTATAGIDGVGVLRGVDIGIGTGETVALIGRNGAGKTSLLRAIMGLLPLERGEITLAGETISALPPHARAGLGIGYAPEDRRMVGKLTVAENMMVTAWA